MERGRWVATTMQPGSAASYGRRPPCVCQDARRAVSGRRLPQRSCRQCMLGAWQRSPTSVCSEPHALYIRVLARQPGRGLCTHRLVLAVKCGTPSPIPGSSSIPHACGQHPQEPALTGTSRCSRSVVVPPPRPPCSRAAELKLSTRFQVISFSFSSEKQLRTF